MTRRMGRGVRRDTRQEPGYFSACSSSYWAWVQPAPAEASLCSGIAALRKASRSGSTTVLPSFLNSPARVFFGGWDRVGRVRGGLLKHILKILLLVGRDFRPDVVAHHVHRRFLHV